MKIAVSMRRRAFAAAAVLSCAFAVRGAFAAALVPAPREMRIYEGSVAAEENSIVWKRDATLPREGYRIEIGGNGAVVFSSDDAGAFYAKQTLAQLEENGRWPYCRIEDYPAFGWRGFMLDESRHFFGKETVKGVLDLMARHKLNVFHWHLTDDQGWRLDIPGFPELVEYGAVRPESAAHGCRGIPGHYRGNGQKYGPYFYTAEDVREILAYAKARFIEVVPEIEIPGHVRALLAARPEFACREGLPRVPRTMYAVEDEVLCAGNDEALRYMERIYDEVCGLFQGAYVHIGGDECPKKRWKECPKCQARIKALGLKDEDGLQAWVTRRFTGYLSGRGRRTVGWDEVLSGDPGTNTVVHVWRNSKYGVRAAERGHDVVVSNVGFTYFSIPQGVKEDPFTYLSPSARCPLAKAYSFDPHEGMTDEAKRRVLGAECCMWSECVWNEYDLAFKLWPRACAFAEAVWTAPARPRDYDGFKRRMAVHRRRLIAAGVNCAPLE